MRSTAAKAAPQVFQLSLPPLPYAEDALAPIISAETLQLHHGKHHRKYVDTANQLLHEHPVEGRTLEDIVRASSGKLFNNAAQAWNHDFYWKSLSPSGGKPGAAMARQIEKDFGSFERFREKFAAAAGAQFGSGWAWLVKKKDGGLEIVTTSNADTPLAHGGRCLLTIDVWEHAYYVDYRNQRERYLSGVIEHRLNWEFAEKNFG